MNEKLTEFLSAVSVFENNQTARAYEDGATKISKELSFDEIEEVKKMAKDKSKSLFYRKTCFFIAFTFYRKNSFFENMTNLVNEFNLYDGFDYQNDPLLFHVKLLNKAKQINLEEYPSLIADFEQKLLADKSKDEYICFLGFLNHYVEVVATYYEINLEKRFNEEKEETLKRLENALKFSNICCTQDSTYPKLFANKGRLLVLLKDYYNGEKEIRKAISLIKGNEKDRKEQLSLYKGHIDKSITIKAFDKSYELIDKMSERHSELEADERKIEEDFRKSKIEIIKLLSIIASLLSFIMFGVQAFENFQNHKIVGLIMLMYAGLVLTVIGLINIIATYALTSTSKIFDDVNDSKKSKIQSSSTKINRFSFILSAILIVLGITMFILGMVIKV